MRRISLVLGVALIMATMLVLTVGSALAKDTQPKPKPIYVEDVDAKQYFAAPGQSRFFGMAIDDPSDGDLGLSGLLDTRITYNYPEGTPGPGVVTTITGGKWTLCSQFAADPRTNPPQCTSTSAVALTGTVAGGEAKWNTGVDYYPIDNPPGAQVYGGKADVEAFFVVESGGRVDNKTVTGGTGTFEGTLDHQPLFYTPDQPPTLIGTLELKLTFQAE
jgi:hypothetical protein